MIFKRFNLSLNNKAYKTLCNLADICDTNKGRVLRNAIALLDYVEEKKSEGYRLALIKDGEIKQEIIMP